MHRLRRDSGFRGRLSTRDTERAICVTLIAGMRNISANLTTEDAETLHGILAELLDIKGGK
jgi:hypothetical protein